MAEADPAVGLWAITEAFLAPGIGTRYRVPAGCTRLALQVAGIPAVPTAWEVALDGSLDGVHFAPLLRHTSTEPGAHARILVVAPVVAVFVRVRVMALHLAPAAELLVTLAGA